MATLTRGERAPGFELDDQAGNRLSLGDFTGKKLLLYFYPKADTPGCTTQSCAVRDALAELKQQGVEAVGVSSDGPDAQTRFDEKYGLGFALLCDVEHKAAEAYGVWGEKTMHGRTYMGITRSAFLIDEAGLVQEAWYKVSPDDTVPNVLRAVGVSS